MVGYGEALHATISGKGIYMNVKYIIELEGWQEQAYGEMGSGSCFVKHVGDRQLIMTDNDLINCPRSFDEPVKVSEFYKDDLIQIREYENYRQALDDPLNQ